MSRDHTRLAAQQARAFLRLLRPHDLIGAKRIRLGKNFDGGYVMLDRFEGVQAAYSLGINDDVSWDYDMAIRGIDVYQYDHTISGLPFEHDLFHWNKIGVSHETQEGMLSLTDMIEQNGHGSFDNMILKCDIEGAEWLTLCFTPNQILRKFSQIVLEVHDLHHLGIESSAHTARQVALNLTASHYVVNVHGNNYADYKIVGGIPVPQNMEITLARKDLGEYVPSTRTFPSEEDMPCDPYRADLYLGRFEF